MLLIFKFWESFVTTTKLRITKNSYTKYVVWNPAICSNVGDLSDLIINNENGYIIENQLDKKLFIEKIKLLLKDEHKRLLMSKKAINFIKKNYSSSSAKIVWKVIFKKLKLL